MDVGCLARSMLQQDAMTVTQLAIYVRCVCACVTVSVMLLLMFAFVIAVFRL